MSLLMIAVAELAASHRSLPLLASGRVGQRVQYLEVPCAVYSKNITGLHIGISRIKHMQLIQVSIGKRVTINGCGSPGIIIRRIISPLASVKIDTGKLIIGIAVKNHEYRVENDRAGAPLGCRYRYPAFRILPALGSNIYRRPRTSIVLYAMQLTTGIVKKNVKLPPVDHHGRVSRGFSIIPA